MILLIPGNADTADCEKQREVIISQKTACFGKTPVYWFGWYVSVLLLCVWSESEFRLLCMNNGPFSWSFFSYFTKIMLFDSFMLRIRWGATVIVDFWSLYYRMIARKSFATLLDICTNHLECFTPARLVSS